MAARRVLISGGAGFIGQHLTLRLRRAGWQVVWLDNLDPQVHGSQPQAVLPDLQPDRFVRGDVTLEADWRDALDGVQAVVHLAAVVAGAALVIATAVAALAVAAVVPLIADVVQSIGDDRVRALVSVLRELRVRLEDE